MKAPRELELEALAAVTTESQLSLEELAALPAYSGASPNPDCVYDGSLVELSFRQPLLADGGELVVSILGPVWDRVFRLEFFGVTGIELSGFGPSLSMDVRELVLERLPKGKRCKILALGFPAAITVTYTSVKASRLVLESPLNRSEPGT
ncbi:hypothetical protein [Pseudoxanthomonas wuyuanensis]|uniref:hypothetical protein n=1 Tax=Pseudoxanthomonas wuyuanensis TaxID=1073196 RepID=UPI001141994F|nr:hypothetical protein [Pseudoxanthomonas wuyuanensis]